MLLMKESEAATDSAKEDLLLLPLQVISATTCNKDTGRAAAISSNLQFVA
jgi:hypothetical protein